MIFAETNASVDQNVAFRTVFNIETHSEINITKEKPSSRINQILQKMNFEEIAYTFDVAPYRRPATSGLCALITLLWHFL